jgi:hypothetical protein
MSLTHTTSIYVIEMYSCLHFSDGNALDASQRRQPDSIQCAFVAIHVKDALLPRRLRKNILSETTQSGVVARVRLCKTCSGGSKEQVLWKEREKDDVRIAREVILSWLCSY